MLMETDIDKAIEAQILRNNDGRWKQDATGKIVRRPKGQYLYWRAEGIPHLERALEKKERMIKLMRIWRGTAKSIRVFFELYTEAKKRVNMPNGAGYKEAKAEFEYNAGIQKSLTK